MLDDVYLVSERINPLSSEETERIRDLLPHPPEGYEAFLQRFGSGTYCDFINVMSPARIFEYLSRFREDFNMFVDDYRKYGSVPDADFKNAVAIATTIDSDFLVVAPDHSNQIYAIPRHDDGVYELPDGFHDLLNWKRVANHKYPYVYVPPFRYFEPEYSQERSYIEFASDGTFSKDETADLFIDQLSQAEIQRIDGENAIILFPQALDGRIQIYQSLHGSPSSITIRFDRKHADRIDALKTFMTNLGYRHTGGN